MAALATIVVGVATVGTPLVFLTAALMRQAIDFGDLGARRIDFVAYGGRVADALPSWAHAALDRLEACTLTLARIFTTHIFDLGLGASDFAIGAGVMLYLPFCLLRGGASLSRLGGLVLGWRGIEAPVFCGVIFGLLSMLSVVGPGVLWAPIAIYCAITGAV